MSEISIIILNYNGFDETDKLAHSIGQWNTDLLDFSVIIVDNCSVDESYAKIKEKYSKLLHFDVIRSNRNGGYSYGNNYGIKYAIQKYHPTYIAIANPDVEIEQEVVINLLDTFKVNSKIAMCAPVMKTLDGAYNIYSQKLPGFIDDLKACSVRARFRSVIEEDYCTIDENKTCIPTELLPGSFFVIRTDCLLQIGMLDENVFLYCEERILGKRLKNAGYIAILRKDLFFTHAHAISTSKSMDIISRWKQVLKSRMYYQKTYERINWFQRIVLACAMCFYILELRVLIAVRLNKPKGSKRKVSI